MTDPVDPYAGVTGLPKTGEFVEKNQPLLDLHSSRADRFEAAAAAAAEGIEIGDEKPETHPLVGGRMVRRKENDAP